MSQNDYALSGHGPQARSGRTFWLSQWKHLLMTENIGRMSVSLLKHRSSGLPQLRIFLTQG